MPKNKQIKLNLGCGQDKRSGFINIDALPELEPDLVHDLLKPLPFKDKSVSYVLAQDILEHFTKEDLNQILADIYRVLKFGGVLELRVPNPEAICKKYAHDPVVRDEFLYGTTYKTGVFGAHKVGLSCQYLLPLLKYFGFKALEFKEIDTNYWGKFKKVKPPKIRKIVYVGATYDLGGAETFGVDLLVALKNKGIKVVGYSNHKPYLKHWRQEKIKALKLSATPDLIGNWKGLVKFFYQIWPQLWDYLRLVEREKNADVIIISGYTPKIFLTPLARLKRLPVVWLEFGPYGKTINRFFKLPKALYFLVKKFPQVVIVPTEHTKQAMINQLHISLAKLKVVPCGRKLEPDRLTSLPMKVAHKEKVIICPSRFEVGKGQDVLVKAFAQVVKKLPTTKLVFTGNDGSEFGQKVKALVKRLGLDSKVAFKGWVKSVPAEITQADICVFPSSWELEGFGLVQIEAMALGKPVVAFNRAPTNEIVADGKTGLLVEPINDVGALTEAIIKLLKDPLLRKRLGKAGKKRFLKHYQMDAVADEYLEVFRWAKANLAS